MDIARDERQAKENAAARVADMLKFPESLDKLDTLRQRTASKKYTVDTRLKTTVQSQLNDVKDGVANLLESLHSIKEIDDNLLSVGAQFETASALSGHTEQVRDLTQQRDELRLTLEQIDSIFSVPENVAMLEKEIVLEEANVLETHHKVAKLETCRDTLLAMMDKERNGQGRQTIEAYFEKVDVISQRFCQRMLLDMMDPLEMIRKGNGPRLVSWLRIIAREGVIDLKFQPKDSGAVTGGDSPLPRSPSVSRSVSRASGGGRSPNSPRKGPGTPGTPRRVLPVTDVESWSQNKSLLGVSDPSRLTFRPSTPEPKLFSKYRPKRLMEKFKEKFKLGIQMKFDNILFSSGNLISMGAFLHAFDSFYFKDLKIAKVELPERFPPDIAIFQIYLHEYHDRLHTVVQNLIDNDEMDPSEIMKVLEWVPKYKKQMKDDLQIDVISTFKEQLLGSRGGGEAALRAQYLEMLTAKQSAWCDNLIATEVAPWMEAPPEPGSPEAEVEPFIPSTNREGLYYTDAPKILFQMIDSQVDVAFGPGNHANFVMSLLDLCMKTLQKFVSQYSENVLRCREMYYGRGQTPVERPVALDLYMMAVVNNVITITENYIPQLKEKVDTKKPADLQDYNLIQRPTKLAVAELKNVAKGASDLLVDIVMFDLKQFTEQLLTPKWMRSKKTADTIAMTLQDYANDFRAALNPKYIAPVIKSCWRAILTTYVAGLFEKRFTCKSKADRTDFVDRLKNEVMSMQEQVEEFAKTEAEVEEDDYTPRLCSVITAISHVVMSPTGMLFAEWKKIHSEYSDITVYHFEAILDFREDLTIKEIRKLIADTIVKKMTDVEKERAINKRERKGTENPEKFFSLIKVPQTFDYFGKDGKAK